jgi:transposase InsO family protein
VWTWDITKLLGPAKWTYYQLYVILEVFSRYIPGWMLAHRESAALAERLIAGAVAKQGVGRDRLTVHADRGTSMTSKPVALLLADLGITKSHSRPHVAGRHGGPATTDQKAGGSSPSGRTKWSTRSTEILLSRREAEAILLLVRSASLLSARGLHGCCLPFPAREF